MRIVLLFFTALFALPLAAQEIGAAQQLRKLMQVYRYLDGLYVDEVEMGPLVESAIEGMLEELDPHSAYIGAEDMKGVQESFDGEFSGIGIEFNVLRDTVIVVNTIVGGPARARGRHAQRPHRAHRHARRRGLQADRRAEAPARQDRHAGRNRRRAPTGSPAPRIS